MTGVAVALTIAGMTLVTVVTRSLFLLLGDRIAVPERIRHGLRYAPVCALSALILPQLVLVDKAWNISVMNPRLDAALVAIVAMLASRSMLLAMSAGMGTFVLLRALL